MTDPHLDLTFKVCLFGMSGVGKTSLTNRFLTGIFNLDIKSTIGASIYVKHINMKELRIALQIWDFGGEDEFKYLLPIYCFGASAGIFMFDLTRFGTLKQAEDWIYSFFEGVEEDIKSIPIYLVGGKSDLVDEREVAEEDIYFKLNKLKIHKYFQTSAKSGENVNELFESITELLLNSSDLK